MALGGRKNYRNLLVSVVVSVIVAVTLTLTTIDRVPIRCLAFVPRNRNRNRRCRGRIAIDIANLPPSFVSVAATVPATGDSVSAVKALGMGDGRCRSIPAWGGEHAEDARIAARLVGNAVKICLEYQQKQQKKQQRQQDLASESDTGGNDVINGTSTITVTNATSTASVATTLDKTDGTPVTALDFAIQGYIISSLKRYEETKNPTEKVSFLGEEDANDLRKSNHENETEHETETKNQAISRLALDLARSLDTNLTEANFLDALDHDKGPSRNLGNDSDSGSDNERPVHRKEKFQHHRSWILDPIDGTRGLLAGKQYAIGLALCVDGEAVLGVLGNPTVASQTLTQTQAPQAVMIAVKGHGLRYYDFDCDCDTQGDGDEEFFLDLPRNISSDWHRREYDLDGLKESEPEPTSSSSSSSSSSSESVSLPTPKPPLQASIDYPPYLLSMGPKTNTNTGHQQEPPLPFGPLCPPTELCCGSLVKYYAIASGQASGFLQLSASGFVKSWDHAPGMLCVAESGGSVWVVKAHSNSNSNSNVTVDVAVTMDVDVEASPPSLPRFDRPEFPIHHGIVCVSREASKSMERSLLNSVLRMDE